VKPAVPSLPRHRDSAFREILSVVAIWIKGQLLIWLCVTALYLAGFAVVHAPLWPLLAVLCGLANALPHFGGILGFLLVLLFAFLGSGGDTTVLLEALAVWLVVQIVDGFVLGPRIMGRKLGLSAWLVFAGGIAGALIAGPIGMLVATLVLAIAAVIWRRTRGHRPIEP